MTQDELFKKLVAHCKEYGFIFPSSEIYDGLGAVYDYGQNGRRAEKQHQALLVGFDGQTPRKHRGHRRRDLHAPPHMGGFGTRFGLQRSADRQQAIRRNVTAPTYCIEEWIAKQDEKIEKEVEKARKRFGESFDEEKYRATSPRVAETAARRDEVHARFAEAMNANDLGGLRQIILDCEIACPISGTRNWTEVRQFNLMFSTQMGSTAEGASTIYLRPETAQGIFVNFLNVQKTGRMKTSVRHRADRQGFPQRDRGPAVHLPHARVRADGDAVLRAPGRGDEVVRTSGRRPAWHGTVRLGFGDDQYRFHDHEKLAHYANAATDIEYNFPFGFKEVEGIHSRTDFDLGSHQKFSGKKMQVFRSQKRARAMYPYDRRDFDRRRPHGIAGALGGLPGGAARKRREPRGISPSRPRWRRSRWP